MVVFVFLFLYYTGKDLRGAKGNVNDSEVKARQDKETLAVSCLDVFNLYLNKMWRRKVKVEIFNAQ